MLKVFEVSWQLNESRAKLKKKMPFQKEKNS